MNMIKKTKIKTKPIIISIVSIILIIGLIVIMNIMEYHNSNQYKLKELGYNEEEINYIINDLNANEIEKILSIDYNEKIIPFFKQKYFIFKNLDSYLKYSNESEEDYKKIVSLINTGAYKDFYTDIKKANVNDKELMLVNKFYALDKTYQPKDIVDISIQYAYEGHTIKQITYNNYINMWNAANKENLTLIVTSSYRNYKDQKEVYDEIANWEGDEVADTNAARPGHSEHQTGYALDISTYNVLGNDFDKTKEFKWLKSNAHKYGFILRYPKDKEDITGFTYESWHYRYVGIDIATKIYNEGITLDEYYAYYIENKKD